MFGGLNIPQNSAHASHLVKDVMIQHDWVWMWPGDSIVPPNAGSFDQKPSLILIKFAGLIISPGINLLQQEVGHL